MARQQKITLGEMRSSGPRRLPGLLRGLIDAVRHGGPYTLMGVLGARAMPLYCLLVFRPPEPRRNHFPSSAKSSGNEPVLDSGLRQGGKAMGEVIAAACVLFSISIFLAHALDAYRTN